MQNILNTVYIEFEYDGFMSEKSAKKLQSDILKYKGIVTYFKGRISLFGFGSPIVRVRYLIPENNVLEYCKIK